jgi:tetratricopeptide (TPR) repeat protein
MYNIFLSQAMPGGLFIYPALCILLLQLFLPPAHPALGADFPPFRPGRAAADVFSFLTDGAKAAKGGPQSGRRQNKPDRPAKQDADRSGREFSISINAPFGYGLSGAMAREAAVSGARILAAERLALELAEDAALLGLPEFEETDKAELLLLGYALLTREETAFGQAGPESPAQTSSELKAHGQIGVLQLDYRCVVPAWPSLRKAYAWLFGTPVILENHRLAAQMEKELYGVYLKAGQEYLQEARADSSGIPSELKAGLDSLRALRIYFELLPGLYPEAPSSGNPWELQARLEEAAALMPDNYLLRSELGRLYAWLEQSDKAALALDEAIRLNPDFARSYSRRSALLLLLQKHSLALADLDRAIRLSGGEAEYYYERAVVWLAMGNKEAMCGDLRASCLAGDCRSHEWAVAAGECD